MLDSSRRKFVRAALAASALALTPRLAWARELIRLRRAELKAREEGYALNGEFEVQLTSALEDALHRGVPLTFVQHFETERPRAYWFAEYVTSLERTLRLYYNALLRQYRLQVGTRVFLFDQLDAALEALGALDGWTVLERRQLVAGQRYRARVRMYLDIGQLPKPLQVNAITSSRWDLDSGWRDWIFRP